MSETNPFGSNLVAVSINLLYDGMEVREDIYDADAARLLITRGVTLNAAIIGKIRDLNAGRGTIYVSNDTYKTLLERLPPIEAPKRREIEETTGYSAAKDETFELLDEIARNKVVKEESLHTVSAELSNRLEVTSPATILSLINALAPVDEYLQRHCVNVSLLNGLIGKWIGLPKREVDELVLIGLLHDCGKAVTPPKVLNAPRKLTVVEFEVIKMHPLYSYDLLTEFLEPVRRAARCHHEKVNGTGYPDRLSYENIPFAGRITAISDIYDAMVSQRAYKNPRSPFSIMAYLAGLGNQDIDAELVNVFNKKMPAELMNKPVVMSDGSIGIVREFDPNDIEYPMIEVNGLVIKSGKKLYCTSMYIEEY